ncbi:altered inheritance of mitochondria protein 31, mitochondrial [Lepidopterella palustris CBS 459.81]|uniref:Altered inheritance of mitochondria protein 31, mitochondrial n=1 Tax=Lepidopterella palustris CBS 459.81 TaxID=1314670 RepID=A0A8E2JEW2_9PEZI|nr:altered inheritance of mitochondria protein 31, mitochondrial [Lepidopterella palustris CBS 459.81]
MASDAPLPSSFDGDSEFYSENRMQKLTRRLREEPLIPLGCLLTVFALVGATRSIRQGNHQKTNVMFRRRIYAQGFTLVAMVAGGMYWKEDREKRKQFEGIVAEKERQKKRDKWIRELEARDEEEIAFKAKLQRRMRGEEKSVTDAVKETWKEVKEGKE